MGLSVQKWTNTSLVFHKFNNKKNIEQHVLYPLKGMTTFIFAGLEMATGESFHNDVMLMLDNLINVSYI